MAREKVKLTVEKAGTGIRYRRMVKGDVWTSEVYPHETRENKREAWEQFVEWRSAIKPPEPERDNLSLIRDSLTNDVQALADHAELTGNEKETQTWKAIAKAIPSANRDFLFTLTAMLNGEVNGTSARQVVEDRKQTARRIKKSSDSSLSARPLADEFVASYKRKAATNRGSWGRYGQVKNGLDVFVNWYGPSRSLEHITEKTVKDYAAWLEDQAADKKWSQTTIHDHQKTFQMFLTAVGEDYPDEISVPNNLRSKRLRIHAERKEPVPFSIAEVKLLLANAVPRTKLFLLLMLNCAMYQGDVADLVATDVDWKVGRVIRPRSKKARQAASRGKEQPFKVNWLLWKQTFSLLKKYGSQDGLVLTTENGRTLITHKETTRNDAIRSCFRRLVAKLKRRKLLPKTWNKTLKQFRKTGANLLEKSEEHAIFYELYLDHSAVARQNYLTSGEPVPAFDAAVKWLGSQIGIK